jgi:hypothetical protein
VIRAAVLAPIPPISVSFPSATSVPRSAAPSTARAAFSYARILNAFSPFSSRRRAIS